MSRDTQSIEADATSFRPPCLLNASVIKINGVGRRQARIIAFREACLLNVRPKGTRKESPDRASPASSGVLQTLLQPLEIDAEHEASAAEGSRITARDLPSQLNDLDYELSKALDYADIAGVSVEQAGGLSASALEGNGTAAAGSAVSPSSDAPVLNIFMRRTHDFAFATPLAPLLATCLQRNVRELRDRRILAACEQAFANAADAEASLASAKQSHSSSSHSKTGPKRLPAHTDGGGGTAPAAAAADGGSRLGRARTASMALLGGASVLSSSAVSSGAALLTAPCASAAELVQTLSPAERLGVVMTSLLCDSGRAAEGRACARWVAMELPRLVVESLMILAGDPPSGGRNSSI